MQPSLSWPLLRYKTALLKITKEKHAHALLRGEVYMNTLHSYSAFANESSKIYAGPEFERRETKGIKGGKNGVQIDECESAIQFFDLNNLPSDFKELMHTMPPDMRSKVKSAFYLEENVLPYLHLFCLYMLHYDVWADRPIDVDPRLRGFGDTAVLFFDSKTFLMRLHIALMEKCKGCCHIEWRPVEYLPETTETLWDQFRKRDTFSWQHEYRVSVGGLDIPDFVMSDSESPSDHMIRDLDPWTLNMGDLSGCAIAFPLEDLLRGELSDRVRMLLKSRTSR